jgi:hypothetical protein
MSRSTLFVASLALLSGVGACLKPDGAPPSGFEHSAAKRTCVEDGVVTAITLAREPISGLGRPHYPFVVVQVREPLVELTGRSWEVGDGELAKAYRVSSDTNLATAIRGRLTVATVSSNSVVEGVVDLTFPEGPVKGTFKATWMPQSVVCR